VFKSETSNISECLSGAHVFTAGVSQTSQRHSADSIKNLKTAFWLRDA